MSTTIGSMSTGQAGEVKAGKFAGRLFTVRHVGATGRTVMVNWTEHGTTGVVFASTEVTPLPVASECASSAVHGPAEFITPEGDLLCAACAHVQRADGFPVASRHH